MTPKELEDARAVVKKWQIAGPLLEQVRIEELRAMTDEEARLAAEHVLSAAPRVEDIADNTEENGLVIQQRWFMKLRQQMQGA